jgi:Cu(I)/Ag(I) efflux system membrane fusion protein
MRATDIRNVACVAAFAVAGCGGPAERSSTAESKPEVSAKSDTVVAAEVATPMMVEGFQVVRVVVRNTGYTPDRIRLVAGTPAKIVFVQQANSHCAAQIQIPDFGVPVTDLPQGKETVVQFSPERPGTYTFTCGMDMLRGTIVVTS